MNDKRITWYFTFDIDQVHPRTGASLFGSYTTVHGTYTEAIRRFIEIFDDVPIAHYTSANAAGVETYDLVYVPCVKYSPGELLPPTSHDIKNCLWFLYTCVIFKVNEHMFAQHIQYMPTVTELNAAVTYYGIPESAKLTIVNNVLCLTWSDTDNA